MGANFTPFGKGVFVSGFFVAVAVLAMTMDSILGGIFLGGLLTWAWAGIVRLAAFAKDGDGVVIGEYQNGVRIGGHQISSEDSKESADGVTAPVMPEDPRLLGRASPARNVEPAASRIIGADARRRVMCAEAANVRHSAPSDPKSRGSEDRDFADFLRSGPF